MHPADAPPNHQSRSREYASHYGFLYHFEDYEIDSIKYHNYDVGNGFISSMLRLPSSYDIIGADKFKLFSQKGVRAKATEDMVDNRYGDGFDYNSYVDFWISDVAGNNYAKAISRSGQVDSAQPACSRGVRPVCSIKPETAVSIAADGVYCITPRVIQRNVCTEEEIFNFLGIK